MPIGTIIRKTGCGTTDATVPREWNQAQKTLAGTLGGIAGNELTYRIDSSGGDSGSPVFEEVGGLAVAIHTNGGCTSSGGTNHGCSILHPDLLAAIADPQGVCIPRYFEFAFPNGLPQLVNPLGGTELLVEVIGRNGNQPSWGGSIGRKFTTRFPRTRSRSRTAVAGVAVCPFVRAIPVVLS